MARASKKGRAACEEGEKSVANRMFFSAGTGRISAELDMEQLLAETVSRQQGTWIRKPSVPG